MWFRRDAVLVGCVLLAVGVFVFAMLQTIGAEPSVPSGNDSVAGGEVVALDAGDLADQDGRLVRADDVAVVSVPADEGFWVDAGDGRVWVQLTTAGESPAAVEAGDRVSFTGEVEVHGRDFADRPEFSAADAEALIESGVHVEVDVADLRFVTR
jgi:hypothetical protein